MQRIATVDPDDNGTFTITFECGHTIEGVSSPIACSLGQGDLSPCPQCDADIISKGW